ncbi:MAG: tRNA 2-selenouridine(34) synthase MnmH [Bacillaceae bacterium]|nr:tRNA 2-selenouridine(34) synthase MnmH [Bacillaceae bacterium]
MQDIKIEEALNRDHMIFIDVRSPVEFEEATIPGAINIPLFSNEEREKLGIVYKQEGPEKAKWLAMEWVSPRIPQLMASIKKWQDQGHVPVIFCWRGGMRSKAVATFAGYAGLQVYRLHGGYRSFRQHVVKSLSAELAPARFIVLHGLTGIGKTQILHKLQEKNQPILDLEGMAHHRGSVFGEIGIHRPGNQKTFDGLLFHHLLRLKNQPYIFMEAESKRIGRVILPDFLLDKKKKGLHVLLTAPLSVRVERTYQEYVEPYQDEPWFEQRVAHAFKTIEKRLSPDVRKECEQCMIEKDYRRLIHLLFEHYYDPRYQHKFSEYSEPCVEFDATDLDRVTEQLIRLAGERFGRTELAVTSCYEGL